jgi:hypothetical protein
MTDFTLAWLLELTRGYNPFNPAMDAEPKTCAQCNCQLELLCVEGFTVVLAHVLATDDTVKYAIGCPRCFPLYKRIERKV